ncbi:MAG: DUF58 domain-containing protein [Micromonosporaceae bacterium]
MTGAVVSAPGSATDAATVRLTGSGVAVLSGSVALLAGGLVLGYPTLTGLGVAGLVASLLAAAFVLVGQRLKVTRAVTPDRVTVGEEAYGRLEVANLGRLATPRIDAVDHLDDVPLPVPVPSVRPRGRQVLEYPIRCGYRGLVRVGPVLLDRRDPLGLVRRSAQLAGGTTLWVRPRVHQVRPLPVGVVPDFEGRLTDQAPRGSMAFSSLREYAPGDDPRQIHWRSTARLGKLVVREHVDTNEPTLSIVLDTRTTVLGGDEFEAAVEVAASVAVASGRVGHAVSLAAVDEDRTVAERAGGHSVLDRLAAVRRTTPASGEVSPLLRLVERAVPGGCLVVLSGDEPGVVPRLATQRRRFSRVVVLLFGDAGESASVTRRPGLAVVRARTAVDAVRAWNQLVHRQSTGVSPR